MVSILSVAQFIFAVIAIVITSSSLVRLRQKRLMYFILLSVAVVFHALGYFFVTTAVTLDGALIGWKLMYLGVPLVGPTYYLFSRDYRGLKRHSLPTTFIILFIGLVFSWSVVAYPLTTVYYSGAEFVQLADIGYLVTTPGILYYPCLIYISIFMLLGIYNLLRVFFMERRFKGAALFLTAVLLPFVVQILSLIKVFPQSLHPTSAALVMGMILMFFFLLRHRQDEWQSTGRELVVENMESAFILVDRNRKLLDYNKHAKEFFPSLSEAKIGTPIDQIERIPLEVLEMNDAYHFDFGMGETTLNLSAMSTDIMSSGLHTGTYILISNDTENHKMMQELTRLARCDDLTGLYNRVTFFRDATLSFDLTQRQESKTGCVLMIDIDYFKTVNDTYGHATGDEVLRRIGSIILNRFRRTDVCGRYGGEELCIWMPSTRLHGAIKVAEEIRETIKGYVFNIDDVSFSVTISVGIASVVESMPSDFEDLMKKADIALYEAKRSGRDRVNVYHEDAPETPVA
ncbi:MAG: diguanylate cyclase [Coriobacteriia bacterium]|nr:diguanylate cyclase [Coriobacteriia bacterium]